MNDFFRRHARQSHERNASKTFCAMPLDSPSKVLGFYTITPSAVGYDDVPPRLSKGLSRHEIAGFKLAWLATDVSVAARGLGGQLLTAAALRCLRIATESGGVLLIIDAKSERAAGWYGSFGAEPLLDRPLTLVMSLEIFSADLKTRGLL